MPVISGFTLLLNISVKDDVVFVITEDTDKLIFGLNE
jgi:hypothetical protein